MEEHTSLRYTDADVATAERSVGQVESVPEHLRLGELDVAEPFKLSIVVLDYPDARDLPITPPISAFYSPFVYVTKRLIRMYVRSGFPQRTYP